EPAARALLREAAAEEVDHLAWCHERLRELGLLNPFWYTGSFALGVLA
ncbi:demethoxyubiquinone hydroxylase family protein, partial [Bordetella pertussis]